MKRYSILSIFLFFILMLSSCSADINSRFSELIDKGTIEEIQSFLEINSDKIDRKYLNKNQEGLLQQAVSRGEQDIVELLLQYNFPLSYKDNNKGYPYDYAKKSSLKEFLKAQTNKNLALACTNGFLSSVEALVAAHADLNYDSYDYGQPLHNAISEGHLDIVKFLIKKGADLNIKGINRGSLLHTAILNEKKVSNSLEMVKYISSIGIDCNLIDWNGQTALFYTEQIETARVLLDHGCNPNIKDEFGRTALMMKMKDRTIEVARILIENGAMLNVQDKEGNTLLHYCGTEDAREGTIVYYMISQKLKIDARNIYGLTPLHTACAGMFGDGEVHREALYSRDNPKAVEILLANGAAVNATDNEGRTPLYYAAETGDLSICNILIEKGGHPKQKAKNGLSPIEIAQLYENEEVENFLKQFE